METKTIYESIENQVRYTVLKINEEITLINVFDTAAGCGLTLDFADLNKAIEKAVVTYI